MSSSPESSDHLDVEYIARLSRMDLSPDEQATISRQLDDILGYIHQLNELDVEGIEPTQHAVPAAKALRPDHSEPWDVLEQTMKNAPAQHQNQFVMPRIVDS